MSQEKALRHDRTRMPQKRPDGGGVPAVVERPDCSLAQLVKEKLAAVVPYLPTNCPDAAACGLSLV